MDIKKILIAFLPLLLSACLAPVVQPAGRATLTAQPTLPPTATVIWFPPTDTPVITPTLEITPTPGVQAELGEVIFRDPFTSAEGWSLPVTSRGQVNITDGELNIIINEPDSFISATMEKPDVGDFYAEITANPVLCSAQDEYGFLFRVYGRNQYYRFALSCSGMIRLDWYSEGGSTVLYPWTRSASVPVGAPSVSMLEVLALKDEIFIYINGDPQFSISKQPAGIGSFGVFARSGGDTPVTVSFSDFLVREVKPK